MKTTIFTYFVIGLFLQLKSGPGVFRDTDILFYLLFIFIILPELSLMFSKAFRSWIKEGVEGADGLFEKHDLKDLIAHYTSLWCIRIFVIASALSMFKGIHVEPEVLGLSFSGAVSFEGIVFVRKWMQEKSK